MGDKVLVAFASEHGSTAGVAEAIGKTLAKGGMTVEVRRMPEVRDLSPYRAVIAGSAIHAGEWLPEAMQFIKVNQSSLRQRPFAAFLVCMTLSMENAKYREHVATWLEPVRELVTPVSEGLFAGVLDVKRVPSFADRLKFRMSVAMGFWKEGDHRDWAAIDAWAASLVPLLGLSSANITATKEKTP